MSKRNCPSLTALISPAGTLGTIFDSRTQKDQSSFPQCHIPRVPFPCKNQMPKHSKSHYSDWFQNSLTSTPHTVTQPSVSLPSNKRVSYPSSPRSCAFWPRFLQPQALWMPFLFLNMYPNLAQPLRSTNSSST